MWGYVVSYTLKLAWLGIVMVSLLELALPEEARRAKNHSTLDMFRTHVWRCKLQYSVTE